MSDKSCKNWSGINFETGQCKVGIEYPKPPWNCTRGDGECSEYQTYTKEELKKQDDGMKHAMDWVSRGVSGCCDAEIDHSQQITEGRHKGHGPHFCSKCKKLAYYV